MKLAARQISEFMASPHKVAGTLIYGADYGQVSQRATQIVNKVLGGGDDGFNRTDLSEEQLLQDEARLADELNAMSLLGGRRLIWLRDAGDKSGALIKEALAHCPKGIAPEEQHYLLVTAAELSPRSPLRLLFEAENTLAALPCYKEEAQSLGQMIRSKFDAAGLRYHPDCIVFLSQRLVGDRMIVERELEKIVLYYEGESQIELETLRQLTSSSQEDVTDSLTHAFAGLQMASLLRLLDIAFASSLQPVLSLRSIDRLLGRIEQLQMAVQEGKTAEQAMMSLRPAVIYKEKPLFQSYLRRWSLPQLALARHQMMRLEAQTKLQHEVDELIVKDGLMRLIGRTLKAAA